MTSTRKAVAVLIFYIDESGHHSMEADRDDPSKLAHGRSDWFVLSAVGIRDTTRRPLAEAVDKVKRRYLGGSADGAWNDAEIKGRRLALTRNRLSGDKVAEGGYPSLKSARSLVALEGELAAVFNEFRPLCFTIAIDKGRLLAKSPGDSALGWAYAFLYRRIALKLNDVFPGEGGVLVADQQTEHENYFLSGDLTGFRDELAATSPLKADYRVLLDRPLWIDTGLSTWDREIIQLADLVAFTTHEGVRRGFSLPGDALWPAIRRSLATDGRGDPDREGLVIFPSPAPGAWPVTA